MKRAYVDSCIWITRFEGIAKYKTCIQQNFLELSQDEWEFCTSEVVFLEVLARPIQQGQTEEAQRIRAFLETMRILKNYTSLFQDALLLAQIEHLKALDAVHVALARHHQCELFVSSDPHFRNLTAITPHWIDLSRHAPSSDVRSPEPKQAQAADGAAE